MMERRLNTLSETFSYHRLPILLLALTAFALYGRILGHEFIGNWDDNRYILENPDVLGISWERIQAVFTRYYVGNYAPVQMLSYMLDHAVWGLWAGGFLLTNLLLHVLNSLLLYHILFIFVGGRLAACFGAGIFMLHPVQVESVAWASQRKNLLAMFFFLSAWELYRSYRDSAKSEGHLYYAASLLAMLLAVLSKSIAVIFPFVILLFDHCYPSVTARIRWLDKIPYLLTAVAASVLAILSQTPDYTEWGAGGGMAGYHGGSVMATFFTMLPVFCSYIRLILWPAPLCTLYDPTIHKNFDFAVLAALLLLLSILFLIYRLYRYDRRMAFWPLFAILALLPVSQIVPLVTLMNDRYLYFPMIAVAALAAYPIRFIGRKGRWSSVPVLLPASILLLLLFTLSYNRIPVWRNPAALWNDTVKKMPNSYLAWEGLGESLHHAARPKMSEAIVAYRRAVELNPASDMSRYNLGVIYTEVNDYENADRILRELLQRSPNNVMGWAAFGDLALCRSEFKDAESRYRNALIFQPEAVQVHQKIGNLLILLGRIDEARSSYLQIEKLNRGNDASAAYQLAKVEAIAGDISASIKWLGTSLERGYNDFAGIMADEELNLLRSDARYADLVKKYFPKQR